MQRRKFQLAAIRGLTIATMLPLTAPGAWAQDAEPAAKATLQVLYSFTGGADGASPSGPLILDAAGDLYGTTRGGGRYGNVFELAPNVDGSWTESVLASFAGTNGNGPNGGLVIDPAGNFYGTTVAGGASSNCEGGCGTVFELSQTEGAWAISDIFDFNGTNGLEPEGGLVRGNGGNLYGTTFQNDGTAYELTPSPAGGWTQTAFLSFPQYPDTVSPLTLGPNGNPYGMTTFGASGPGTVFELVPSGGGTWNILVLYAFDYTDGAVPEGGVIFDSSGNIYGTTNQGGPQDVGNAFQLVPGEDGTWTENVLHSFTVAEGAPDGPLASDATGNLYGVTAANPYNKACGGGVVFRLATVGRGRAWRFSILHCFSGGNGEPGVPSPALALDSAGNLYGTTYSGGSYGYGVVFKITPQ